MRAFAVLAAGSLAELPGFWQLTKKQRLKMHKVPRKHFWNFTLPPTRAIISDVPERMRPVDIKTGEMFHVEHKSTRRANGHSIAHLNGHSTEAAFPYLAIMRLRPHPALTEQGSGK